MRRSGSLTRRAFIVQTGAVAAAGAAVTRPAFSQPEQVVAVARCRRYDFEMIRSTLSGMFDQIGGIDTLIRGKRVTVKVNVTGGWHTPVYTLSPVETVYTHPLVVLAACSLLKSAGASRIVIAESLYSTADPRTAFQESGYDVQTFESTIPGILWENTRNRGSGGSYRQVAVGTDAYLYRSFMLNHRYVDTDVMVSIPKLKNHLIAGITAGMKNLFGLTPSALYSSSVHNEGSTDARIAVLHEGGLSAAGGEVLPIPSLDPGLRVPRAVVDIVAARPIDLTIIDAIVSMHGGEGAWAGTQLGVVVPGLLVAGRNPVATDSVAAQIMGYSPDAADGTIPFQNGSNMLKLAEVRGLGPRAAQVVGIPVERARYMYLPVFKQ